MSDTTKFKGGGREYGRLAAVKEHGKDALRHLISPKMFAAGGAGGNRLPRSNAMESLGKAGKLGLGAAALGLLGYGGMSAYNAMSQASPYGYSQLESRKDPGYYGYEGYQGY